MEEILASIRRIIADDDAAKTPKSEPAKPAAAAKPAAVPPRAAPPPPPAPPPAPPPPAAANNQDDIDAMLASFDAPSEKPAVESASNDILDLTEAMAAPDPAPPTPAFRTVDSRPEIVFDEGPEAAEPARSAPSTITEARRQFRETTGADRSLLSSSTTAAVDSAFNTLAQTVLVQNSQTLDGLVKEMLRPMLKAWLDDNLPTMVERLVRAEIERVSRGRG